MLPQSRAGRVFLLLWLLSFSLEFAHGPFAWLQFVPFLLLIGSLAYIKGWLGRSPLPSPIQLSRGALKAWIIVLCVVQFAAFAVHFKTPRISDIGEITLKSNAWLLEGKNPYHELVDPTAWRSVDPRGWNMTGYRYLPVTLLYYVPFQALGPRGIVLGNFLLILIVSWLIAICGARRFGSAQAGLLGAIFFLSCPLVPYELLRGGTNDLIPAALVLVAVCFARSKPFVSGLLCGLSISSKLLPGVPATLVLFPRKKRHLYVLGVAAGLVPILPFLFWHPEDLLSNVVLFNFWRDPDHTSWAYALPAWFRKIETVATIGIWIVFWWLSAREEDEPAPLALNLCLALALTLFLAPINHPNYQLWWLPLAAIIVARIAADERRSTEF